LLFINSFNYIDGVDGLAITQFLIFICYIDYLIDDKSISYGLINLMAVYSVMLICNFSNIKNIKTFLGDSGSLMTGFLICFLTILAYVKFQIHPIKLAYALSYPVYDFLRVNITRLKNKKKLFQPGKDHLHHLILYKFTKNHFKVTLIIVFLYYCNYRSW
jgi:UDP-GlcNAc:undecaprenyl-phosphate GlcNAc-1-phosphate transferase